MQIKGLDYHFQTITTIGDGSCFLHAILGCCSAPYQKANKKGKQILVQQLRHDLAEILDVKLGEKNFYQRLSRGQIEEIAENVKEMKKDYMQAHLKSGQWLNGNYLELISILLNLNIVIISAENKAIYPTGDKEIYFQHRHTIFINYYDQAHFESIGIVTEEGIKTLFHRDSKIVKDLEKIL